MARTRRVITGTSQSGDPPLGPSRRIDPEFRPRLFASLIARFGIRQPASETPETTPSPSLPRQSCTSSAILQSATPSRHVSTSSTFSAITNLHPTPEAAIFSIKHSYIGQKMRLNEKYIHLCEEELLLRHTVHCLNDQLHLLECIKFTRGSLRTLYKTVEYERAQAGIRLYMLNKKKRECQEMIDRAERMFARRVARVRREMAQKKQEEELGDGIILREVLGVMDRYRNYVRNL
ncbi:hypothetical protein FPQ18DRAFT_310702 [Pyronema domesticum]|uniref:Uncharacterized protein n=1 Tax=Pyronema omphalodes (strain CBS 100304) TaxID=1076935 RepID=U4KV62_PYROM|nr:hypothetical protein FPQ18DRAFT_310702 [Pyronema domesticum]CCX05082.1 Protein of unknown function [Pyronema omphalodes CBS 100304]